MLAQDGAKKPDKRSAQADRHNQEGHLEEAKATPCPSVVPDTLPHELRSAFDTMEQHRFGAQHQNVTIEVREAHLRIANPVRVRADLNVVHNSVLIREQLVGPGIGEIGADRLRALASGTAKDVGIVIRRTVGRHDLDRHVAVVVVEDETHRMFAQGINAAAIAGDVLPAAQPPGSDQILGLDHESPRG